MPPPTGPVKMASNYKKPSNLKTALVLLTIAAVFFAGVVVNRMLFGK